MSIALLRTIGPDVSRSDITDRALWYDRPYYQAVYHGKTPSAFRNWFDELDQGVVNGKGLQPFRDYDPIYLGI